MERYCDPSVASRETWKNLGVKNLISRGIWRVGVISSIFRCPPKGCALAERFRYMQVERVKDRDKKVIHIIGERQAKTCRDVIGRIPQG